MRCRSGAGLVIAAALVAFSGRPVPSAEAAETAESVIACETLVNLRLLMAEGDREIARLRLPQHPGCRAMARDRVGDPERRAMIGGTPFECAAIRDEAACAWIFP